jgi:hypothetical protein
VRDYAGNFHRAASVLVAAGVMDSADAHRAQILSPRRNAQCAMILR